MRKSLVVICLCISFRVCAQDVTQVINAEKAFAAYALEHNTKEAFLKYMDSTGVVFGKGKPQNAIEVWKANKVSPIKLLWTPAFAGISISGDLGFTTGPWEAKRSLNDTALAAGEFSSVWKKNSTGEWKNIVDLGNDFSMPAYPVQKIKTAPTVKTKAPARMEALEIDRDFIKVYSEKGPAAFLNFLMNDTWLNMGGHQPYASAPEHKKVIGEIPAGLIMHPLGGGLSAAHDIAYVYGSTDFGGKTENYLRVWQHTFSGWKIILQVLKW